MGEYQLWLLEKNAITDAFRFSFFEAFKLESRVDWKKKKFWVKNGHAVSSSQIT
jgi:hypothetical protein